MPKLILENGTVIHYEEASGEDPLVGATDFFYEAFACGCVIFQSPVRHADCPEHRRKIVSRSLSPRL